MFKHNYPAFLTEAIKITAFCLMVPLLFSLFGASHQTLLIVFNMAVMSSAATFSVERNQLVHVLLGSVVVVTSIILGGLVGSYLSNLSYPLVIVYAGLAFFVPKTKMVTNILVTGAVMFFISYFFSWFFIHRKNLVH